MVGFGFGRSASPTRFPALLVLQPLVDKFLLQSLAIGFAELAFIQPEAADELPADRETIFHESDGTADVSAGVTRFKTGCELPCGGSTATQVSRDLLVVGFLVGIIRSGLAISAASPLGLPRRPRWSSSGRLHGQALGRLLRLFSSSGSAWAKPLRHRAGHSRACKPIDMASSKCPPSKTPCTSSTNWATSDCKRMPWKNADQSRKIGNCGEYQSHAGKPTRPHVDQQASDRSSPTSNKAGTTHQIDPSPSNSGPGQVKSSLAGNPGEDWRPHRSP